MAAAETAKSSQALRLYLVLLAVLAVAPLALPQNDANRILHGLAFGLAALGFNLLLGYTGLLSFGHAAYFGVGMYTVAVLMGTFKILNMEVLLLSVVIVSAGLSALLGFLAVRHTRIFFSILTLALAQVLWSIVQKSQSPNITRLFLVSGGSDGMLVGRPVLFGLDFSQLPWVSYLLSVYYYYVLLIYAVAVLTMWLIVRSPFGMALEAIRDNETRAQFIGLNIQRYRLLAFIISGTYTGLGGALFAPMNGLANPDFLYWIFSGKIVFMTILGGFTSFAGPLAGAIAYIFLETTAIGFTLYWQMMLGIIFIALVLLVPNGLVGGLMTLSGRVAKPGGSRRS